MSHNPLIEYPCNVRVQLVRERELPKLKIQSALDVDKLVGEYMRSLDRECVLAIYLDSQNRLLGVEEVARGTLASCQLDPRDIMKSALLINSNKLIVVHNHVSGLLQPSDEDRHITKIIQDACRLFNTSLLDHIVIGDGFHSILHS